MAIHHLDFLQKSQFYSKLFHTLKLGGLFLNLDMTLPCSEKSEEWQFRMWTAWINKVLSTHNLEQEVGTYDGLPQKYQNEAENKPSGLFDQLQVLQQVGFRNVDCYYKYGSFALFGGTKP